MLTRHPCGVQPPDSSKPASGWFPSAGRLAYPDGMLHAWSPYSEGHSRFDDDDDDDDGDGGDNGIQSEQ
eukprot:3236545-Amphidinium_carterae.1